MVLLKGFNVKEVNIAGINLTTSSLTAGSLVFNGGLNTTAGPLSLQDNESPDLQNVDFNKFGSVLQRNGTTALNTSAITGTESSDGLYWFEFDSGGTLTRKLVNITNGKLYKQDGLDGTWDDESSDHSFGGQPACDTLTLGERYTGGGGGGQTITVDEVYFFNSYKAASPF